MSVYVDRQPPAIPVNAKDRSQKIIRLKRFPVIRLRTVERWQGWNATNVPSGPKPGTAITWSVKPLGHQVTHMSVFWVQFFFPKREYRIFYRACSACCWQKTCNVISVGLCATYIHPLLWVCSCQSFHSTVISRGSNIPPDINRKLSAIDESVPLFHGCYPCQYREIESLNSISLCFTHQPCTYFILVIRPLPSALFDPSWDLDSNDTN